MKLDFDISTIEYMIIHEILTQYLNAEYDIWVFGSRVKNQTKHNSDLDLAIGYKSKIDIKLMRKIKRALEESKLPFKVDVLDLNATSEEFNTLIKKDMIPFPLKYLDKVPQLRFKEFSGEWEEQRADYLLERYSNPVDVNVLENYRQIGTRSHGKGIFHKESVTGKELGNKRVFWVHDKALVINIVFAWEHSLALTSQREKGFIASHRFPMYLPKENRCNLNFILEFFLRKYGKYLLELASPGGAGRNKTLGQSNFNELKLIVPSIEEQEQIVRFLSLVDKKIEKIKEQLSLLQEYKKGVIQKIFSQNIRFKNDEGGNYSSWKEYKLLEIAKFRRGSFPQPYGLSKWYDEKNGMPFIQVYDVDSNMKLKVKSKNKISQLAQPLSVYVAKGNVILTIQGSIGRIALTQYDAYVDRTLLIFTEYLKPINKKYFIYLISLLFEIEKKKAPGGTIKTITKEALSNFKINLPLLEEQIKIANFLTKIDQRIEASEKQLKDSKEYKKSLLQQMFI